MFENKKSSTFLFCVTGLVSGIVQIMIVTSMYFWGGNLKILSLITTPFWYIMIQSSIWAYCQRIKAIGGILCKEERYINHLPWVVLVFQFPTNFMYLYTLFTNEAFQLTVVVRAAFSILIALIELYLYYLLLRKMNDLLEYRVKIKRLLKLETTASVIILILLDILLIVSMLMGTKLDYMLRPFTYLLRIVVLIRFFTGLLQELESNSFSRLSNRPTELVPEQLQLVNST